MWKAEESRSSPSSPAPQKWLMTQSPFITSSLFTLSVTVICSHLTSMAHRSRFSQSQGYREDEEAHSDHRHVSFTLPQSTQRSRPEPPRTAHHQSRWCNTQSTIHCYTPSTAIRAKWNHTMSVLHEKHSGGCDTKRGCLRAPLLSSPASLVSALPLAQPGSNNSRRETRLGCEWQNYRLPSPSLSVKYDWPWFMRLENPKVSSLIISHNNNSVIS